MMDPGDALDDVQHQLNVLVSARLGAPLTPADEERYQELCVVERSLLAVATRTS
jgi:hypothetical protein